MRDRERLIVTISGIAMTTAGGPIEKVTVDWTPGLHTTEQKTDSTVTKFSGFARPPVQAKPTGTTVVLAIIQVRM